MRSEGHQVHPPASKWVFAYANRSKSHFELHVCIVLGSKLVEQILLRIVSGSAWVIWVGQTFIKGHIRNCFAMEVNCFGHDDQTKNLWWAKINCCDDSRFSFFHDRWSKFFQDSLSQIQPLSKLTSQPSRPSPETFTVDSDFTRQFHIRYHRHADGYWWHSVVVMVLW